MNSREITNYIKGFAILAVCVNHFVNGYVTNTLSGYANGFISIFLILSGYGIYHSLVRQKFSSFSELYISFQKKRLMRIYPLFWIYCALRLFPDGILGFLALNFIDPKTPWFIPAIIQCYIIAPFLFIFTKQNRLKYSFLVILGIFVLTNALLFNFTDLKPVFAIGYRDLFFLHIFQFYLGYVLARVENIITYPKYVIYLSFVSFGFFIHETTGQAVLSFSAKARLFPLLMSISAFLLCLSLLSSKTKITLPFKNVVNFLGTYSFSIYLFHEYSFGILSVLGIVHRDGTQLPGIMVWVFTLPLFILMFAALETVVNEFAFGKRETRNALETYFKKVKKCIE